MQSASLEMIEEAAAAERLAVLGAFHAAPDDRAPAGVATLVLLGPAEPGFWAHLTASPEWSDGRPDPVDRWSERVISALAARFEGRALFPFGGPDWHPFYAWALRTGRAWASPVRLLVHEHQGLMVSYRGAIGLPGHLDLPAPPGAEPCGDCGKQPCRTACPVAALSEAGLDAARCHAHLDADPATRCLSEGCAARRSCPISQGYGRLAEHSSYHMRQFHR